MTEKQMWERYIEKYAEETDAAYEAWCFGSNAPDELAELTKKGIKTATASAYPFYEYEQCELPKEGSLNLILRTDGTAVCITKTTKVRVVPFNKVTAEHAYKEGEGDRSLAYWQEVHRRVFIEELREINYEFTEEMLVVCEEFQVVYFEG